MDAGRILVSWSPQWSLLSLFLSPSLISGDVCIGLDVGESGGGESHPPQKFQHNSVHPISAKQPLKELGLVLI